MLADRKRFAHDFDNDPRASEGFDFDSLDGGPAAPAESSADGLLSLLIHLRDSSRARLTLDCLVLHVDGGGLLPELTVKAIAAQYLVSAETARQALQRIRDRFRGVMLETGALRILLYLRGKPNLRLMIDCLILAYGGNRLIPDLTMRSLSRQCGKSVETVSNICERIRADLHLPRNQNNKPESSLQSYRDFNYRPSLAEA